jgi:maleylacetate reductase
MSMISSPQETLLLTIGAGSLSDIAKNVKFGLSQPITPEEFPTLAAKIDFSTGNFVPPAGTRPLDLKLVCVPTSLSAGEYNPASGCLDRSTGKKSPYYHPDSMPDIIICDPFLGRKTPEWVWMSTGVRSIDHAVETLCNATIDLTNASLVEARQAAKEGLSLLLRGLIAVKEDAGSVNAREMCQRGAWKASLAIVRGVSMGGSHAIGHVLGPLGGVAHGHTSCVCLPAVLRYNYKVNAEQQEEVRQLLYSEGIVEKLGLSERKVECWEIIRSFIRYIGMPGTLSEVGIQKDQFEDIAKGTMTDFWARTNPIPLTSPEQVMEILEMAA